MVSTVVIARKDGFYRRHRTYEFFPPPSFPRMRESSVFPDAHQVLGHPRFVCPFCSGAWSGPGRTLPGKSGHPCPLARVHPWPSTSPQSATGSGPLSSSGRFWWVSMVSLPSSRRRPRASVCSSSSFLRKPATVRVIQIQKGEKCCGSDALGASAGVRTQHRLQCAHAGIKRPSRWLPVCRGQPVGIGAFAK
jgi:hypothetical protein